MKHICEEHGSRKYRLLHNFDIILYLFWLGRILFIGLMYFDPETFPLYKWDYGSGYFWQNRYIFNKFLLIILIFIVLGGFLGLKTFFYQRSDQLSFQVLYDCVVFNTDQYWKSRDSDENVQIKKFRRFRHYRQQFNHDHRFLSMIKPLANRLVSIRVWLDSWLQMDRIDRKLFQQHNRMRLFPYAPIKGRNYALMFILFIDNCNYFAQVTYCKYFFFKYKFLNLF